MTGAAIGSAAVGGASLLGGVSESRKAGKAGDEAIATSNELSAYLQQLGTEGREVAQKMMDDWEGTFGGIQDNLSEYYSNLDPNKYSTEAKTNLAKNMDKQMLQFNEEMAAQGLQSAGMQQQAGLEASFRQAEGNAAIDIGAEDKVMGMKQGFLNSGENQRSQANSAMQNSITQQGNFANIGMGGVANAQNNQAQAYGNSSAGYMGAAGSFAGSALGLGLNGGGLGGKKKPAGNYGMDGKVTGGELYDGGASW